MKNSTFFPSGFARLAGALVTLALTVPTDYLNAQVGINSTNSQPHSSAMLDVSSTTQGVLISRMTSAERDAISSPAPGLLIFNTTTGCLNAFDGTNWGESCFTCVPQPTAANAGADQPEASAPTTLSANAALSGTGTWTVISGDGNEVFGDTGSPTSSFDGTPGQTYVLRWTISTSCSSSQDDVTVSISLPCPPTFTDSRDGEVYNTVLIGDQCWMKDNLAYLPSVSGTATKSTSVPYQYVFGYNGTNVSSAKATSEYNTCGVLYNFASATNSVCPSGWHLPTDAEFQTLEIFLGMSPATAATTGYRGGTEGTQLKATSSDVPSFNGTNTSGFKAGACGWYDTSGFGNWGSAADFWTTTSTTWRRLAGGITGVGRFDLPTDYGASVRCVKD